MMTALNAVRILLCYPRALLNATLEEFLPCIAKDIKERYEMGLQCKSQRHEDIQKEFGLKPVLVRQTFCCHYYMPVNSI